MRLKCDLSPPHWKRVVLPSDRWDAGYEKSAYFLDYLQGRFGEGTVRQINNKLRQGTYSTSNSSCSYPLFSYLTSSRE